jgi:hypothetical protein
VRIVGSEDDLALSGWAGASDGGPVVALGDAEAEADVRFAGSGSGRLIGPAGDGLWRRSPWPARDELFDLEPPADPSAVLVVGDANGGVVDGLRANGVTVAVADALTLSALRGAAIVVLLGGHGALPAQAPCVLAARRVLVTDATDVTFGLQAGIQFLLARHPGEAVERAGMAAAHPRATAGLRAMGAIAARPHRASIVYERLAADLQAASSA